MEESEASMPEVGDYTPEELDDCNGAHVLLPAGFQSQEVLSVRFWQRISRNWDMNRRKGTYMLYAARCEEKRRKILRVPGCLRG